MISDKKQDIDSMSDALKQKILDSILSDLDLQAHSKAKEHDNSIDGDDVAKISPSDKQLCSSCDTVDEVLHSVPIYEDDGVINKTEPVKTTESAACNDTLECETSIEEEKEEDKRLSCWQRVRILYLNRKSIASMLYSVSFYATYLSWIMLAVFVIGRFMKNDIMIMCGVVGSLITVFASIVGDEVARKLLHTGRKIYGIIVIVCALFLLGMGIYGIVVNDYEFITGGVLGMFGLSFVPWILDSANIPKRTVHQYRTRSYNSGYRGGYSVLGDALGIPQPKEIPPIEISRDDDLDDEWRRYLSHNITIEIPDIESAPIHDAWSNASNSVEDSAINGVDGADKENTDDLR